MPALDIFLLLLWHNLTGKPGIGNPVSCPGICLIIIPLPIFYYTGICILLQKAVRLRIPKCPYFFPRSIVWIPEHCFIKCFRTTGVLFSHKRLKYYSMGLHLTGRPILMSVLFCFYLIIQLQTPLFCPRGQTAQLSHPFPDIHQILRSSSSNSVSINS